MLLNHLARKLGCPSVVLRTILIEANGQIPYKHEGRFWLIDDQAAAVLSERYKKAHAEYQLAPREAREGAAAANAETNAA